MASTLVEALQFAHPSPHLQAETHPVPELSVPELVSDIHTLVDEINGQEFASTSLKRVDGLRIDTGIVRPQPDIPSQRQAGVILTNAQERVQLILDPDTNHNPNIYVTTNNIRRYITDPVEQKQVLRSAHTNLAAVVDDVVDPKLLLNGRPYRSENYEHIRSLPHIQLFQPQSVDKQGNVIHEKVPGKERRYKLQDTALRERPELLPELSNDLYEGNFEKIYEPVYQINGSQPFDKDNPTGYETLYDRKQADEFGPYSEGPNFTLLTLLSTDAHQEEHGRVAQRFAHMNIDWALESAADPKHANHHIRFNISPETLMDDEIQDRLRNLPEGVNIIMEVLENKRIVIPDEKKAGLRDTLKSMQAKGIRIAIDDFVPEALRVGKEADNHSEYNASALSELIDIDEIKVAPSMIFTVAYDEAQLKERVRTLITEMRKLGPKTLTFEGIKLLRNIDTINEVMDEFIDGDPNFARVAVNVQSRVLKKGMPVNDETAEFRMREEDI